MFDSEMTDALLKFLTPSHVTDDVMAIKYELTKYVIVDKTR